MKTTNQTNPDLQKLCDLIQDMSICMLTTIDVDHALVSRPMAVLEMDSDGVLWFFTNMNSEKTTALSAMNLTFTNESNGTYISLSGCGEINSEVKNIERLWTFFAKPWFPEGVDSTNLVLLKFLPNTAEYWDAPQSKMVRIFAMAASIIAGKPIGLGEHDTLKQL
jgi:general stress protein 26